MEKVTIFAESDGSVRCIYIEAIDLAEIGRLYIDRASHVEYDNMSNCWRVTWTEASEMRCGDSAKFASRTEALHWEEEQLIRAMARVYESKRGV